MKRFALTAGLFVALVSQVARAANITYQIQNYPADQNGATVTGTITTDGTLGVLSPANILNFSVNISTPSACFTFSSTDPDSHINGGGVVATSAKLTLSAANPYSISGNTLGLFVTYSPIQNSPGFEWSRGSIFGFGPTQYYFGAIPNSSGTGSTLWSTNNPAMGGTDPWVLALAEGPAPTLYTVTNANELAAVDVFATPLASGTTIIGITQDSPTGPVRRIRGLAYDGGNNLMYGLTREGDLVVVDIFTGQTSLLESFGTVGDFWSGFTFDGTSKLYATNASGTQQLAEIDLVSPGVALPAILKGTTAFITPNLISIEEQILGLGFYPSSAPPPPTSASCTGPSLGVLYGSDRDMDNVVVVKPADGVVTLPLGDTTVGVTNLQAIAFHPQTGELYAIHDHAPTSDNAELSIYNFTTDMSVGLGELPFGIVENGTPGAGNGTYGWGGLAFAPNLEVLLPDRISTTASGLAYSFFTHSFNGTVTIKNIGGSTLSAPVGGHFYIVFTSPTPNTTTLINATGTFKGSQYIMVPNTSLAPNASATVAIRLNLGGTFKPVIYLGVI